MTRLQPDTSDTLTRPQVSQLAALKKNAAATHVSELFHLKKSQPAAAFVTLICSKCGRAVILEVLDTAHCLPCRRIMRPAPGGGGKGKKAVQHAPNLHEPRPKRGSNRPIMNAIGGLETWHAHQ